MTPAEIERARVLAAEQEAIAGIPANLLANMAIADAKFKAAGGCPGCGSEIVGVHYMPCSWCDANPDY